LTVAKYLFDGFLRTTSKLPFWRHQAMVQSSSVIVGSGTKFGEGRSLEEVVTDLERGLNVAVKVD
jgi:hypothetical protein